jgi:hypothetical protein
MEIVKFMPTEMRLRIVKEMVTRMGIRPLATTIDVNSKTIYKYKLGLAAPTDDTMDKILTTLAQRYPDLFEKYMSELKDKFRSAFENMEVSTIKSIERASTHAKKEEAPLARQAAAKIPTEMTKFEIYERLRIISPADRIVWSKVLAIMQGMQTFSPADVSQRSSLAQEELLKMFQSLEKAGYLREISPNRYRLNVKIVM